MSSITVNVYPDMSLASLEFCIAVRRAFDDQRFASADPMLTFGGVQFTLLRLWDADEVIGCQPVAEFDGLLPWLPEMFKTEGDTPIREVVIISNDGDVWAGARDGIYCGAPIGLEADGAINDALEEAAASGTVYADVYVLFMRMVTSTMDPAAPWSPESDLAAA